MAKIIGKIFKYACITLACAGVGFGIGYIVSNQVNALTEEEQKLLEEYHLLKDDWLYGNESDYLDELIASGLISDAADYYEDPYTIYTSTYEEQGLNTDHLGLGFTSHSYDGGLYVAEVHTGANEDKLEIGDVIYGCYKDDDDYYDFTLHSSSEISTYLSDADENTTYIMDILRDGEMIQVELVRTAYTEKYVRLIEEPSQDNNFTLTIKINTFLGSPASEVASIISSYQNVQINKLVIDLRQNGGGLVSQAELLSKLFVKNGTLIYQFRNRDDEITKEVYQTSNPTFSISEYALIIDDSTASAAETFTLAMRAGTNCTVYGLTSYGKGVAQELKTFSDGSVLRYTSCYVYGPERENETMYDEGEDDDDVMCIHGKGIIPDVSYSLEYTYLQSVYDYTDSIYITESEGEFLLSMMNDVYPEENIPSSYSSSYRFEDAVYDFTAIISEKYETEFEAFLDDGVMSKEVNDKLIKESYDAYLEHYSLLSELATENL